MNNYFSEFFSHCPTNGVRVKYSLGIETPSTETIVVELLLAAIEDIEASEPLFHEEIADRLAARFAGQHTLRAHHHGVDITTTRTGEAAA